MKKSWRISVYEQTFLFLLCLLIFCLIRNIVSLVLVLLLWYWKTRDYSFVLLAMACCLVVMPRFSQNEIHAITGSVYRVSDSYVLVKTFGKRVLVWTKDSLPLDSIVFVKGEASPIDGSPHFFGSDFGTWANRNGIYYSLQADPVILKERHTLRWLIQKKVSSLSDNGERVLMNRLLFHARIGEENWSWLFENGFSVLAGVNCIDWFLSFFLPEKKKKKLLFLLVGFLGWFYYFPLLLVQKMIAMILTEKNLDSRDRFFYTSILIILLYPNQVRTMSFLYPFFFRCVSIFDRKDKILGIVVSCILQSVFYFRIMPVQVLFYPIYRIIGGVLVLLCWMRLLIPVPLVFFAQVIEPLYALGSSFSLPGSVCGFGLIFYIAFLWVLRYKQWFSVYALVLLFLFQSFGFFHPLPEVSCINVGQGTSILIRIPFKQVNILIDTGKPSACTQVENYLNGKGIRELNVLYISHSDNDHSGNAETLANAFRADQVITSHFSEMNVHGFTILDLNEITDEDENESSLVLSFALNGVHYLAMGDADEAAEEAIVQKYGNLRGDITVLSHHGSKSGSCDRFLDIVRPAIALISSGPYEIYHHPSEEVIQRLLKRHIPYFDTKESGDISVVCLGPWNLLLTASGEWSFINSLL